MRDNLMCLLGLALVVVATDTVRRSRGTALLLGTGALLTLLEPLHVYGVLTERGYAMTTEFMLVLSPAVGLGALILAWVDHRRRTM